MAEEYLTDDEQWEAVKRWLAENLVWLIAGVVIGAGLLFGFRYYQSYRNERAFTAAAQFGDMSAALERNDHPKARQVAEGLLKDYPGSPYADQAQLALARLYLDEGQAGNAVAPLTHVMNDSKDSELRHIARLRLARVLTDLGKPDQAISTLGGDDPGVFGARYDEVRGDAYYAKKDPKNAIAEYKKALAAAQSANTGSGIPAGVDPALLELKIADLTEPPGAAPAPASAAAAPATPQPEAKH